MKLLYIIPLMVSIVIGQTSLEPKDYGVPDHFKVASGVPGTYMSNYSYAGKQTPWTLIEYLDFEDNLMPSNIASNGMAAEDLVVMGGKLRFTNLTNLETFGWVSPTDVYSHGQFFLVVVDFDSIWSSTQDDEWLRIGPQIVGTNAIQTFESSLDQGISGETPWDSVTSFKYNIGEYVDKTMRVWGTPNRGTTILSPGDYIHFKIYHGDPIQTWNGAIETMAIYMIDRSVINNLGIIVKKWDFSTASATDWVANGGANSTIVTNSLFVSGLRTVRQVNYTFTNVDSNSIYWCFAEDTLTDLRQEFNFRITGGSNLGAVVELDGVDEYWGFLQNYETIVPGTSYQLEWDGTSGVADGYEHLNRIYLRRLPRTFFTNYPL